MLHHNSSPDCNITALKCGCHDNIKGYLKAFKMKINNKFQNMVHCHFNLVVIKLSQTQPSFSVCSNYLHNQKRKTKTFCRIVMMLSESQENHFPSPQINNHWHRDN